MLKSTRILSAAAMVAALDAGGYCLIQFAGNYGLTLFVVAPICLGAISAWLTRPNTWQKAIRTGATGAFPITLTLVIFEMGRTHLHRHGPSPDSASGGLWWLANV